MENEKKFFNQSRDIAQKPIGDSGFFNENEEPLTNEEKREDFFVEIKKTQELIQKLNSQMNNLLENYKSNPADRVRDEQELMSLQYSLDEATSNLNFIARQIEYINNGQKKLHQDLESQAMKN